MSRADEAVALAADLWRDAEKRRTRRERAQQARLARILEDPGARSLILALTDEVLRIRDPSRAARVFRGLEGGSRGFGTFDRAALGAGARIAAGLPGLVVPAVRWRVREEMAGVILPAGGRALGRHIAKRRRQGIRLNINVLGETVLGEDEAERRLQQVIEVLGRDDVDYVSVKISSICSQLDVLAFDHEVDRIAERLRRLYAAAGPAKFVNLDMEEYHDLELTAAVFEKVLDEAPFERTNAGIVLQAYLPDSLGALEQLSAWARGRHRRTGAWVKVRLVKGANLAMEGVDAEVHGWPQAPFGSKAETDANYKRMLAVALDPANDPAVRVGVATHNLFEMAWAALSASAQGAAQRVSFEMLEGMSPAVSEAAAARFGGLLLYAPLVRRGDLEAAIAYLVRRLDENSSPENFIAHQYSMRPGGEEWESQAQRFRDSVLAAGASTPATRRVQDRSAEDGADDGAAEARERFLNEPDTDFTIASNRRWVAEHLGEVGREGLPEYRPVVAGRVAADPASEAGIDPSREGRPAYRWAPASMDVVEEAVAAARNARGSWPADERRRALLGAADELARRRGRLLAVMAADTGKTVREGDPEVSEAIDFATYYSRHIPGAGFTPHGTVVVASPWNFPLSIPAGGVLAALAAGSCVILKPAPEAIAVAGELAEALWAGGVPKEMLQFLPCTDGHASRSLIEHHDVDAVVLTGSWDTAQMFLSWRPSLALHAETSGKNAILVTATADYDQAIADLVRSAFGHAGQKCSAASLAILERSVYDDGRFLRRLADAAASLRPGPAGELPTTMGPLIRPPEGPLRHALEHLDAGERWLLEPRRLDEPGYLWSPGIKVGVLPGSPFHLTECFGPVLGVMRARDLEEMVAWENQPAYGLTAGLQSLDPAEIDYWRDAVEAGNLYVNRGITGAIVARQPFGGWKHSVVGPGAKAGGPNYVASMGTWAGGGGMGDYAREWRKMRQPVDEVGLRAESNAFRYRPLERVALVESPGTPPGDVERTLAAASAVGVEAVSASGLEAGGFEGVDKVRFLAEPEEAERRKANESGAWVDVSPVTADAGREMLRWVREQAVSESRHRHGHVTGRRPGLGSRL